jgi:hypothetical protein
MPGDFTHQGESTGTQWVKIHFNGAIEIKMLKTLKTIKIRI